MTTQSKKVLVLGVSGMLGNAVFRLLSEAPGLVAMGAVRSPGSVRLLPAPLQERVIGGIDVENGDALIGLLATTRPDVVVNCVGLVKQLAEADDPLSALPLNSLMPHRLARLCGITGARLIHISTDCVFSGAKGMYVESDESDARDLYGRSKYLGEVDYPHAITLRTSIIGPELGSPRGLVGWFLSQRGEVKGFTRAIFSGLPTVELARIICDHVIPRPDLRGVYHVSAEPIAKYELLKLVAAVYGKNMEIVPDDRVVIDRSLDSSRFRAVTGYRPNPWPELVRQMHAFG